MVGLKIVKQHRNQNLRIYSNSQLVTNQIAEEYQAKNEHLVHYMEKVKSKLKELS